MAETRKPGDCFRCPHCGLFTYYLCANYSGFYCFSCRQKGEYIAPQLTGTEKFKKAFSRLYLKGITPLAIGIVALIGTVMIFQDLTMFRDYGISVAFLIGGLWLVMLLGLVYGFIDLYYNWKGHRNRIMGAQN